MTTRGRISRRTVLRGLGAAVALPWLEAMLPGSEALANGAAAARAPRRMAFIYVPNGIIMPDWTPRAEGTNFELPSIMQPLAPFKQDMLVLSGLTCDKARANGDGPGDHARASGAFLTGAQPRKTAGANYRAGLSADQVAAIRLGDRTRLPSLEISLDRFRGTGNCDSGYSCVYVHTLSWRNETAPVPAESDPRLIFERLFSARPNDPDRIRRDRQRASVLDAVLEDARSLDNQLGGADRQRLDQYLSTVREIEQRISRTETLPPVQLPEGTQAPERRLPANLTEHFRLVGDLMALALQTDVTRVISCMFAREGSNQQYRHINVSGGHHELTHHGNNQQTIAKIRQINTYHVEQLAYFLGKLRSIREGEGTLLDNCMIAYGSAIADGNRHTHHDLPIVVAGKGGGTLRTGRHIRFRRETPLNNLWLAMLDRFGAPTDRLGDSTGVLQGLS
ncbi:MAG: DUF1552 domain-containing protein [Gemmataceae bacterium]|nr:DUF1552 domain-containing protein [Gemmataceae bacterium]